MIYDQDSSCVATVTGREVAREQVALNAKLIASAPALSARVAELERAMERRDAALLLCRTHLLEARNLMPLGTQKRADWMQRSLESVKVTK